MGKENFQPETPILEKPTVVGFVDLTKFEKQHKKTEVKKLVNENKKPEPRYLINAKPLHQTVGSIIKEHFGGISVAPDGSLQTSKPTRE